MVTWLALMALGWVGDAASQQFSFRQYAQSDGLTNLAAGYLVTDPGGDLWVGTDGGLFRFDGTAFVSYDTERGLPSETVRGMALDASGRLWVTLDRGLYVGGVSGFEPVRTQDGPVLTDHGLPIAFLGDGHVLVGSKSHVRELQRKPGATFWESQPLFSAEQIKATPELDKIASDSRLAEYQPYWAVRAELLTKLKKGREAREAYQVAIGFERDPAVRVFLQRRQEALPDLG